MRLGRERKMEEQRERVVAEAEDWTNSTKTDWHGSVLPHLLTSFTISKTALLWILFSFYRWKNRCRENVLGSRCLKIQPSTAHGFHFKVEGARSALRTEHVGTTEQHQTAVPPILAMTCVLGCLHL